MSAAKRYGDPVFGNTLADLKVLTTMTQAMDGLKFEGPARKVGAFLTLAAATGELIGEIEDLELALQDAEGRADNAGRNASAFEDRMGDLQVENGKLRDQITELKTDAQRQHEANRTTWTQLEHAKSLVREAVVICRTNDLHISANYLETALPQHAESGQRIDPAKERAATEVAEQSELRAKPSPAQKSQQAGHPMQPIEFDGKGVIRFRENRMVRHLLDFAAPRGCGLNELARMDFSQDDRMQLAQLIGYSVSGYGDLGYASDESVEAADQIAADLHAAQKEVDRG
ncbi:hypothetical protein NAV33_07530 [Pseudomonas stutzeri]|uniref:hypothetical protein n=1 Tax=Stutzerimonas stutzeri TaxID=316 RepID=UPI00210D7217|nr:hypothetical protein [Stutzerimonas stutzeri]MCQ4311746.1 hypothetical protein [Stutzerimonas stutzeri]